MAYENGDEIIYTISHCQIVGYRHKYDTKMMKLASPYQLDLVHVAQARISYHVTLLLTLKKQPCNNYQQSKLDLCHIESETVHVDTKNKDSNQGDYPYQNTLEVMLELTGCVIWSCPYLIY